MIGLAKLRARRRTLSDLSLARAIVGVTAYCRRSAMPVPVTARILVADDDADIRELVVFKLSQAGYAVEAVKDGTAAWETFKSDPPDLVVLDIQMPGLNGIEVLRKIRAGDHHGIPVVLLSAKSRDHDVDLGFAVGADDYVIKPFSPRELLHRVTGLLRRTPLDPTGTPPTGLHHADEQLEA